MNRWMALPLLLLTLTACGPSSRSHSSATTAGATAPALLSASTPGLRIEVDYVADRPPTRAALTLLRQRLGEVCDKPSGVEVVVDDPLPRSSGRKRWTTADLQLLEAERRDLPRQAGWETIYVVLVEGEGEPELGTWPLGYAYGPTSVAVFIDQVRSSANQTNGDAEAWVLLHEVGHLLGLVGRGAPQVTFHEDLEHRHHCVEARCVMRKTADARDTDYGPRCREDLRAAGGR
jgi:hypothetical protein